MPEALYAPLPKPWDIQREDNGKPVLLYTSDQMRAYADATCSLRGADEARQFPDNTCPASRHAQMIGEALVKGEAFPQLSEEPAHCGQSILATVEALYRARTALRGGQQGADPYIPLMAEQAMTIDRDLLRSALLWYGISWGEDSDEAFACRVGQFVNELTRDMDAKRRAALAGAAQPDGTSPSDWPIGEARRYAQGVEDGRRDAFAAAGAAQGAEPHSWKEEQARFFGISADEVPASPQPPTGTEKK